MQVKKLVSLSSRTGRDLQRYNLGCRQVVGCIPWRYKKSGKSSGVGDIEFLLISSQKSPKWMFPKGGWELDESMEEAAIRETMEEAGVLGEVGVQLGMWRFKSRSQDCFHEGFMFAFEVKEELDVWPEKDIRQRVWLPANEAREKCAHQWMKDALDIFLCQFTELQSMEQEQQQHQQLSPPSLFDLFVTEPAGSPTITTTMTTAATTTTTTIVSQNENDVASIIDCHVIQLPAHHHHHRQRKDEQKIQMPYFMDLLRAEGPMIDIMTQSGQLSQQLHQVRREEDCLVNCLIEFFRTEEPRNGGEEENVAAGGCLVT